MATAAEATAAATAVVMEVERVEVKEVAGMAVERVEVTEEVVMVVAMEVELVAAKEVAVMEVERGGWGGGGDGGGGEGGGEGGGGEGGGDGGGGEGGGDGGGGEGGGEGEGFASVVRTICNSSSSSSSDGSLGCLQGILIPRCGCDKADCTKYDDANAFNRIFGACLPHAKHPGLRFSRK